MRSMCCGRGIAGAKPTLRLPCSLSAGLRFARFLPAHRSEGDGAPRGATYQFHAFGGVRAHALRARLSALHRGFSVPGVVLPGANGGPLSAPIRGAFAPLHPRRVQPSKAAGLGAGGRLPGASRGARLRASPAGAASRSASKTSLDDAPRERDART
jgi:hypothetical protein